MTRCIVQRAWKKVAINPDTGCWDWTGAKDPTGYGRLHVAHGDMAYSHRVLYEALVGPIPDRYDIDHLCRNRGCVNPGHLEPVTRRENLRRGRAYKDAEHRAGRDCGLPACRACQRFRTGELPFGERVG